MLFVIVNITEELIKLFMGIQKSIMGIGKNLYSNLDWQFGMFGENLTIDNLDETKLHQGDTFKVGETILEVTKGNPLCETRSSF